MTANTPRRQKSILCIIVNDKFFNGNTLDQEPTYIIHGHLTRTFRPGLWVGMGVGYD